MPGTLSLGTRQNNLTVPNESALRGAMPTNAGIFQRETSYVPVFVFAMKACHVLAEYLTIGPAGSTESLTAIAPRADATSTQAPLATLRRDFRQAAPGPPKSMGDIWVIFPLRCHNPDIAPFPPSERVPLLTQWHPRCSIPTGEKDDACCSKVA